MITVTAAIIEKNGLILAAKRKEGLHLAGYWEFPGGKLENGEQPEEGLQRELKEEFNIESVINEYLGESIFHYSGKSIRLLGYLATHTDGDFSLTDHDEIRWLPPEELHSLHWAPADIPLVNELIEIKFTGKTLAYYNNRAKYYVEETISLDIEEVRNKFTQHLPLGAHILDLGCGSGRDSKAFLDLGYSVTAFDPSQSIAALASQYIGQEVQVKTAQEIHEAHHYDAIWACASLLHIPKSKMQEVFNQLISALKPGGILYMSFKKGTKERLDERGRFFNDYMEAELFKLLDCNPEVHNLDISAKQSILRGKPQIWLNIFAKKNF